MRVEVRIEGTVQGVGFRPFVYRLAHEQRLGGHVFNDERGVAVEVEGADDAVATFLDRLRAEAPPLARLDRVSTRALAPLGAATFEILASRHSGDPDVVIAADTATCPDCLAELRDPADRRYRYPFINCTNCGPRFTIVQRAPYDRARTTMSAFTLCDACRAEYEDPLDRRFHAQPTACPTCGPHARLVDAAGRDVAARSDAPGTRGGAIAGRSDAVEQSTAAERSATAEQSTAAERSATGEQSTAAERSATGERSDAPEPGTAAERHAPAECRDAAEADAAERAGAAAPLDAIAAAAAAIARGAIVAVKGLGGYHLACDATNDEAVAALRARKRREDKPFALMVRDVAAARRLVELSVDEAALLTSPARPIVLARRRAATNPTRDTDHDHAATNPTRDTDHDHAATNPTRDTDHDHAATNPTRDTDHDRAAADSAPGADPNRVAADPATDADHDHAGASPAPDTSVDRSATAHAPDARGGCSAADLAPAVAPVAPELGVMLPATPIQHLLIDDRPLVMTSGNTSDEPIVYTDEEALARLSGIADLFLIGDRPIETRVDDSIARVLRGRPQMLRRARGYAPSPLALPVPTARPLLATGAELKSTFTVARAGRAWVSHHLGDLEHYSAFQAFERSVARFEQLFEVVPEVVVHDLHPDYRSTAYALAREDLEPVAVQHHHAHLAACLAEHGVTGRALGAIFDGTGYGDDGTIWGGELLLGDLMGYERVGALHAVRMPGGEAAVREPWRMACAWLIEAFGELPPVPRHLRAHVGDDSWATMAGVARSPAVSPVTTSMGRLFDAVAALCGIAPRTTYEGQAAIELAAAADGAPRAAARDRVGRDRAAAGSGRAGGARPTDPHPAASSGRAGGARPTDPHPAARQEPGASYVFDPPLDARPVIRAVYEELERGVAVADVAARFHDAVARATIAACREADTVVLSGGVFQNRRLTEHVHAGLSAAGVRVLLPERLPPNDGGISFGQAAIVAARLR